MGRRHAGISWGAATLELLDRSAHRSHLSAIRFHVALLAGSRVTLAICWHSAARFRNSSGGFIAVMEAHFGVCSCVYQELRPC
jgi:hypothetical protein